MKWENNYLKIYFPKHKSDQIGLNKDEARHVYSNPNNPSVCPLRTLTFYLIAFPSVFVDGNKLFPGKDQKKHCLYRETNSNSHLCETINVAPKELGSHSICKGAATYCCAAVHPGPPIISVCLRADWCHRQVKVLS